MILCLYVVLCHFLFICSFFLFIVELPRAGEDGLGRVCFGEI